MWGTELKETERASAIFIFTHALTVADFELPRRSRKGRSGAHQKEAGARLVEPRPRNASTRCARYFTALIMSKMGRYIATIMPPTTTPSTTIMIGSMALSSTSTAASTSSS